MNKQSNWQILIKQHGESEARKILSDQLREAADQVLNHTYPDVYDCTLKDPKSFIYTVSVTLSFPWPG